MEEDSVGIGKESQDWQRVDARILGQILAAQNLLFVLPDEKRIADFFSAAIREVPGIISCLACMGDLPAPGERAGKACDECLAYREKKGNMTVMPPNQHCRLGEEKNIRVLPLNTTEHTYGFFILKIQSASVFESYRPFLQNLAAQVALSLENRIQKFLLEQSRDELEAQVVRRTEELRQMNERFSLAVNAAHMGVWDWDIENDILVWDERMYELYGVKDQGHVDAYETWLNGLHPDDRVFSDEISKRARRGEQLYDTEFRVIWPDQSIHHIKAQGQILRNDYGEAVRMIGINFDITNRKQAEENIRRFNQELEKRVLDRTTELEKINKELESFAHSVSHDLLAPLRLVDGFLELLKQRMAGMFDEESRHYLNSIFESTNRMSKLVDDLLSFSRMARNDMAKNQIDMNRLVKDSIEEFAFETQDRCVRWNIARLPTIDGDPAMLRLVLTNLISNALKFSRKRSPVEIEIGHLKGKGDEIVFFVRDNGVGFDMAYSDKLFNVFQRLHLNDEFEGNGIGLANVRRIIHRHGGRTWADSTPDQGATFYFSLPRSYSMNTQESETNK